MPLICPTPPAPPERAGSTPWVGALLPLAGAGGSVMAIVATGAGGGRGLAAGAVVVSAALVFALVQITRHSHQHRRHLETVRASYAAAVAALDHELREHHDGQVARMWREHPRPDSVAWLAGEGPIRPDPSEPRGACRVGTTNGPPDMVVAAPDDSSALADPVCLSQARRLLAAHAKIGPLPVVVELRDIDRVRVVGPPEETAPVLRAVVVSLAWAHPPDHMAIQVGPDCRSWSVWLPHLISEAEHVIHVEADPHGIGHVGSHEIVLDVMAGTVTDRHGTQPVDWDRVSLPTARAACRAISRRHAHTPRGSYLAALGLPDSQPLWGHEPHVRVPLGTGPDGPVSLHLGESAVGGDGPHGLLIGATGSGKSEVLRTVITGLTLCHHPDDVSLVLVDFKGGATFADVADLPHVAALVTNLADDDMGVDRLEQALLGEIERRQHVLRDAGCDGHQEYVALRRTGVTQAAEPMPALVIVVDEFAELLTARPDFIDTFVAIGRIGRSLGMHLLLASQRLDEGRLRGLDSHLSYRIAMRTVSAAESRAAIGTPHAASLPPTPGMGLLATASGIQPFHAYRVSAPEPVVEPAATEAGVRLLSPRHKPPQACGPSLLTQSVRRMAAAAPRTRQIWSPPPASPLTLDACAPGVGLIDDPRRTTQPPLMVDPADDPVCVVGRTGSGRSNALIAITLRALEVDPTTELIGLGAGLEALRHLPQTRAVSQAPEDDLAEAVWAELDQRLATVPARPLLVVIDDWSTWVPHGAAEADLALQLLQHATRLRLRMVASASRWQALRPAIREEFTQRLELRLGDPFESELDRTAARRVSTPPGHGLSNQRGRGAEHCLIAQVTATDVARIAGLATTPARPVMTLPSLVTPDEMTDQVPVGQVPLGVASPGNHVLALAPTTSYVVWGEAGSGRSTALRTWVTALTRLPVPPQLMLIHPRRTLSGFPAELVVGSVSDGARAAEEVAALAAYLRTRLPGPEVTPEQFAARSWWTGSDVVVVVDDHELLPEGAIGPLAALLPHAGDIGLSVVVARRFTARPVIDPAVMTLIDQGCPGLVLSGPPESGAVHGVLPRRQPPGRGVWATAKTSTPVQVAVASPVDVRSDR